MAEQMTLRGTLKGHNGWVTQIATTPQRPDMILSSSRGEKIVIILLSLQCSFDPNILLDETYI